MADYYPSIKGSAGDDDDDDDDSGADDNRWTKIPNWIAKILFIKQCCSEKNHGDNDDNNDDNNDYDNDI